MTDSGSCACRLDRAAREKRIEEWRDLAEASLMTREAIPDGVRLSFAPEPGVAHALVDLVDAERSCCDFAEWTMTATEGANVVSATTHGDGVALLQGLFEVAT